MASEIVQSYALFVQLYKFLVRVNAKNKSRDTFRATGARLDRYLSTPRKRAPICFNRKSKGSEEHDNGEEIP